MARRISSILAVLFLWSTAAVVAQCPDLDPVDDGTGVTIGLVISEIDPGNHIEVYNFTDTNINLSGSTFFFCSPFSYTTLSVLGATDVPAQSYATLNWPPAFSDTESGGEVILYSNGLFSSASSMVDFACWGVNPHSTRKALAESANKWSGACAAALTGGAIHRRISADGTTAADYDTSSSPSPLNCTVCAPTPGQVTNLQVETANGGADLFFTWTDLPAANDYVVFEDAAPDDVFSTEAGTATSGVSGLTIPMPPGTKFYLVAGRNITCGLGPKH